MAGHLFEKWLKPGLNTLIRCIRFFYGHPILVLIAFIPASTRFYQMWLDLNTPVWVEVLTETTRLVLFLMIVSILSKVPFKHVFYRDFWNGVGKNCTLILNKHWPAIMLSQFIVFIIVLYGLMNIFINIIVNISLGPVSESFNIEDSKTASLKNALLFFLKNISVIPLAMTYMVMVFGLYHPSKKNSRD